MRSCIGGAPVAKHIQNRDQLFSFICESIFNFWRDYRIHGSGHYSIIFKLTQLLGKHFLSYSRHKASDFIEPQNAIAQMPQDNHFPLATDNIHSQCQKTWIEIFYKTHNKPYGIFLDTIYEKSAFLWQIYRKWQIYPSYFLTFKK